MKKFLVFILILLFNCPAFGASWKKIELYSSIDLDSIKISGDRYVIYWIKLVNDGSEKSINGQKVDFTKYNMISDCKQSKISMKSAIDFGLNGDAVLHTEMTPDYDYLSNYYYIPIVPESRIEYWHKFACKYVSNY